MKNLLQETKRIQGRTNLKFEALYYSPEWTCATCTFLNSGDSNFCAVCGSPKP